MNLPKSETVVASRHAAKVKQVTKRTRCLRADEAGKWNEHFRALMEFKMKHNHCIVPRTYSEDPGLGRWVKRQRYQYKCFKANKKSSIMPERIDLLEKIGFVWDPHEATWKENIEALIKFKIVHGNCDVPYYYARNPHLATWVTRQRHQYTLFNQGKKSSITPSRIATLEGMGFKWNTRDISKFPDKVDEDGLQTLSKEIDDLYHNEEKNTHPPGTKMKMSSDWQPGPSATSEKIFSKGKEISDLVSLALHQMPLSDKFTEEDGKMLLQALDEFDDDSPSVESPSKKAPFEEDKNESFNYHEANLSNLSDDETMPGPLSMDLFDVDFIN